MVPATVPALARAMAKRIETARDSAFCKHGNCRNAVFALFAAPGSSQYRVVRNVR